MVHDISFDLRGFAPKNFIPAADFGFARSDHPANHKACAAEWEDEHGVRAQSVLLIVGEEPACEWREMVVAAGARMLGAVPVRRAMERLALTVDVDVMLVDCRTERAGLDTLIARLDAMANAGGAALIFVTDIDGLDMVVSLVSAPDATILCEPAECDLVAALFAALQHRRMPNRLHDSGRQGEPTRLQKLTEDVRRLTHMLESFLHEEQVDGHARQMREGSVGMSLRSPERTYAAPPSIEGKGTDAHISAEQVRALLRARRLRDQMLAHDLFADPAWDILLDLTAAHLEGSKVSVSSLCIAAAVPPTTALRWIQQLTDRGLLVRRADPQDGRRIFITLSPVGLSAVQSWFDASRPLLLNAAG